MKKSIVKNISFYNYDAEVLLTSDYIDMPKSWVFKSNHDNSITMFLKPGDKFIILNDKFGIDFAYVFGKHFHLLQTPNYPDIFIQTLPLRDRMVLKRALRREMINRGKMPHLIAYKNLRDIMRNVR